MYFFFVIFISIFSFNPIYLVIGFSGALFFGFYLFEKKSLAKSAAVYLIVFIAVAITNPLFSHNGATVLFFINDNRVTLEAFIYGAVLGLAVIEVIFWFKCINSVFDSEKLIFLFGKIFPKLALVFSMTLRFIPEFVRSFKNINTSQKLIGKKIPRLKRYMLSFSAVITQSMENSILTSDSMKARGYGLKPRSFYYRFRFTVSDAVYLIISAVLFTVSLICVGEFTYYPELIIPKADMRICAGYVSFFLLSFIPFIYEVKEGIRWKYSISKI